ncbi:PPM-type phosphatase domain [Trypanosoma melophagium]|uniref:PPM-type phosphatase domain n=1 Tax=Trypanosoma melophagium TaxID=715481 RepID=UPI00351A5597|nr:PPM-type phosphatase domain [Trypanosoma melophagium]
MEDQHAMVAETIPFFGVYDGHGGTQCAEFLRDNLHTFILSRPDVMTSPEQAIRAGIATAERAFLTKCANEKIESGSTCAIAMIVDDTLVTGNVGDTEIVLCRAGSPLLLSTKHSLHCNEAGCVGLENFKNLLRQVLFARTDYKRCFPSFYFLIEQYVNGSKDVFFFLVKNLEAISF